MEAGIRPSDGIPTSKDYALNLTQHKASTEYKDIIEKYMRQIPESEVLPGDVVAYKIYKGFAHAAIVVEWPNFIVHSLAREGVHAGHGMNFKFSRLPRIFFTVKDEVLENK